jgi:hypothetical protein
MISQNPKVNTHIQFPPQTGYFNAQTWDRHLIVVASASNNLMQ